jgi:hypothetical protein
MFYFPQVLLKTFCSLVRCNVINTFVYVFKLNDDSRVSSHSHYANQKAARITTEQIQDCTFVLQEEVLTDRRLLSVGVIAPLPPRSESLWSYLFGTAPFFFSWTCGWAEPKDDRSLLYSSEFYEFVDFQHFAPSVFLLWCLSTRIPSRNRQNTGGPFYVRHQTYFSYSSFASAWDGPKYLNPVPLQWQTFLAYFAYRILTYCTKTLITNKCTKRVLSSIVTHSYMFRLCWVIFKENFFVIVTLRLHFMVEWGRAVDCVLRCFWRRELFAVPAVQAGTADSSCLQYTVNSTLSLNYKVQPECNDNKNFSLKMTQQGRNM